MSASPISSSGGGVVPKNERPAGTGPSLVQTLFEALFPCVLLFSLTPFVPGGLAGFASRLHDIIRDGHICDLPVRIHLESPLPLAFVIFFSHSDLLASSSSNAFS